MRVDLHSHTHFSRDGLTTPEDYVVRTVDARLDAAAVTDHNNIEGALEVQKIAPFRVIVSEEIKSIEGEIIGLFLKEPVARGMTPEDTVRAIKEQGGLVLVPHPFDRLRRSSALGEEALVRIVEQVDLVEVFNARTVLRSDNTRAARFARNYGKLRSAGSDSHSPREIGRVVVDMPPFEDAASFLVAVRQAKFDVRYSSIFVHLLSTYAKLKWRLGLGVAK